MKTVATANTVYADPSALLKLYLHEPESQCMAAWRTKARGSLPVTHHGRVELVNGIALAAHRNLISESAFEGALAALDDDFAQGRSSALLKLYLHEPESQCMAAWRTKARGSH